MYCKCANCETILDWNALDRIPVGVSEYWGVPRTEYADTCPRCGSDEITDHEEDKDETI